MQVFTFSVRTFFACSFACFLCSFTTITPVSDNASATALLEGKWICGSKSGQLSEEVSYQLRCGGDVQFRADHLVESTTTDAFLPTGAGWQVQDGKLCLLDSYGSKFVDFEIKSLNEHDLVLCRKGVDYGFVRAN